MGLAAVGAGPAWLHAFQASPLVAAHGADLAQTRRLRLEGTRLYLDRCWREELRIAFDLRTLAAAPATAGRPDAGGGDPLAGLRSPPEPTAKSW